MRRDIHPTPTEKRLGEQMLRQQFRHTYGRNPRDCSGSLQDGFSWQQRQMWYRAARLAIRFCRKEAER